MSKTMTLERATEFGLAWNSRDPDLVASFFADDGVYHASVGPDRLGKTYLGREEIRKGVKAFFERFPDGRFENLKVVVAGDVGSFEWDFVATDASGRSVTTAGCDRIRRCPRAQASGCQSHKQTRPRRSVRPASSVASRRAPNLPRSDFHRNGRANWCAPDTAQYVKESKTAAESLGIELQIEIERDPKDLEGIFVAARGASALLVADDAEFTAQRTQIAELALKNQLPTVSGLRELAEAGGLMTYGPSFDELYWRAAGHVYKIPQGVNVADLPIEQPVKFDFVLNMRRAKALDLTIPPSLIALADEVIE